MNILAIDPGTTQSGWCWLGPDGIPVKFGVCQNGSILTDVLPEYASENWMEMRPPRVAIEMIEPRGMGVGADTFRTVWWAGRFAQAWVEPLRGDLPIEIFRSEVKTYLCGNQKAKDGNIRQALITRYGGEGDKAVAIGKKATPGPLYGISSHVWAALAVAVTARAKLEKAS